MEKSNFDQLLQRYLTGEVTEEERIKIDAWLETIKTKDNSDLELSREDEDKLFQRITSKASTVDEVISMVPPRRVPRNYWLKVAATFLLIAVAAIAIMRWVNGGDNGMLASGDGVEKLILNDGSLVWLRGQSSLQYYHKEEASGPVRYAQLRGEGLFEVAKDPDRPFIIQCGDVNVRVVGTSFSLRAMNDTVMVSVLTGKVNLSTADGSTVDVLPKEKVIYAGKGFEKLGFTDKEEQAITSLTEYDMSFRNVPMSTVIERIEKKFDVEVKVVDRELYDCHVTMDITDQSLETSMQIILDILDVQYTTNGRTITLRGRGC